MRTSYAVIAAACLFATQPAWCQPRPGDVDLSFDAGSFINAPVYGAAVLGDGRVLITGDFKMINGEMINGLARLQTNGATDFTFTNTLGGPTVYGRTLSVQPDGKILVGGQFNYFGFFTAAGLARFNADGSVDRLAGYSGSYMYSVVQQKDGRILLGGSFSASSRNNVMRLNSDLSLDTTFLYGLSGANNTVNAVAVQPDNQIIIAGSFTTMNGATCIGIARLNPDGTLDSSFSASVSGGINSVAIQSDGKLVIGGTFTSVNGYGLNRIARLNANGSLDTAFSAGRSGANGSVATVTLQSDGKILLTGAFSSINGASQAGVARLNTDGSRDSTFSVGSLSGTVYSLALLSSGQMILAGSIGSVSGTAVNNLAKVSATGALDTTFGNGSTYFFGGVSCVVTQNDGKALVNGVNGTGIGRLGTNGTPDPTFLAGLSGANGTVNAAAVSGGKIIVGGAFSTFNGSDSQALARLNIDGSLDTSFKKSFALASGSINRMLVQPDGRIVVGGAFTNVQGLPRTNLARLNSDGSVDPGFMNNSAGAAGGAVQALALQTDGKLLVGGAFTNFNGVPRRGLVRLNTDGSVDAAFQTNTAGVAGTVYAVAVQPDARVLIGGYFSSVNNTSATHIARLNADGTLDLSFSAGTVTAGSAGVRALALQTDGRVLAAGQFSQIGTLALNNIARLSATGAVESFMTAGADAPVYALALLDDTRMLVGGGFGSINGAARSYISRVFYNPPPVPTVPLDVALNNSQLSWTNDPAAPWTGQAGVSHDGVAAAQSGLIGDNQSTSLSTSVVGPATLRFWWKVSSETNFDFLTFTTVSAYELTTNQVRISGETGWLQQIVALPDGPNTLQWTYSKDGSVSIGQDTAWLDEVSLTPGYTAPIVVSDPANVTNFGGGSFTFTAGAVGTAPMSYQWLLNGVPVAGATNSVYSVASTVPEQAGTYTLLVSSAYGTNISAGADLVVIPVRGYGNNSFGQSTITNFAIGAVAIAAGQDHSLLLRGDGSVYAWGQNGSGQCNVPADLGPAIGIAGGGYHSLAITAAGSVSGWGDNTYGQASAPAGPSNVIQVAAGFWHSLALCADGTVIGWGDNTFGQSAPPVGLNKVVAIAAGGNHSLALRSDGVVVGWGQNTDAQGTYIGQSDVPWTLKDVVDIAAGEYHSLVVTRDGSLVAWGDNSYAQCSVPKGTNVPPALKVAAGGTHSLAVLVDGTAIGWGDNFYGQSSLPRTLTNVVAVAAGNAHSLELFGLRPAPQAGAPSWKANTFSVPVQTFADRLYSLEYVPNLLSTNWLPLPLTRGTGGVQVITDGPTTDPQRYYRVRQW